MVTENVHKAQCVTARRGTNTVFVFGLLTGRMTSFSRPFYSFSAVFSALLLWFWSSCLFM